MSVKFRPCAHGISVTLLVLLLEPQSLTAQFVPPCCTSPHSKWAMGFLADLDRQPDMQFDVESAWLLDQFNKLDQSSLVVVGAGFVMLLASATEDFSGWCSQRPALEPLVHSVFAVLLLGYVIDVSALILQLS